MGEGGGNGSEEIKKKKEKRMQMDVTQNTHVVYGGQRVQNIKKEGVRKERAER